MVKLHELRKQMQKKKVEKTRGISKERREMIKKEILEIIEHDRERFKKTKGLKEIAQKMNIADYIVYINAGKKLREEMEWKWEMKYTTKTGKIAGGVDKYAAEVKEKIKLKDLGKNLSKDACIFEIKRQLAGLGVPSLYDIGVSRELFDKLKDKLKKEKIWDGM